MKVAIIMGSLSDHVALKPAEKVLAEFGVAYDVEVVSAHRTPSKMYEFALGASKKYSVIIAAAGGAAHLPGMVASLTTLPVIGVPVETTALKGLDAVLSIVQMPAGVPVACVGLENAKNAALLAVRILALEHKKLEKRLQSFFKEQTVKVRGMNKELARPTKKKITPKRKSAKN